MTKIFIFIDESGTLPDPKDLIVVLVAIETNDPVIFEKILKPRRAKEFKFYSAGDQGRKLYLESLAKKDISIFTLAVKKSSQKIIDSPQNYAVLSWLLLIDCLASFGHANLEVIFDKHFQREVDEKNLFSVLQELLGLKLKIRSADSKKEPGITAADMVAGAFLYAQSGKTEKFYRLVKEKVISEKVINWKEAKKNFIEALKNSSNRCKHPSNEN